MLVSGKLECRSYGHRLVGQPVAARVVSHAAAAGLLLAMLVITIVGIWLSATTPRTTPLGRQALRSIDRTLNDPVGGGSLAVDGRSYRRASYTVATRGAVAIKDTNLGRALPSR